MKLTPHSRRLSIVLLGNFNPVIFSPYWFAKNGIVGEQTAQDAEVEIIHPEISRFVLGNFNIGIDKGRFAVDSMNPPDVSIQDLVIRTFREFLSHTPIRALGVNLQVEFEAGTVKKRNGIGRLLAPVAPWGEWGKKLDTETDKLGSGLMTLAMRELISESEPLIYTQAKIEPSHKSQSMILMDVNNHFSVVDSKNIDGAIEIMDVLEAKFQQSIDKSEWIINQIMEYV